MAAVTTGAEGPRSAETVLLAGRALTMAPAATDGPVAVVIDGGCIAAVVPRERAIEYIGRGTEVLDAGDRTVLPGFVDPHAHAEVAAKASYWMVDARAPGCASVADVLDTLRDNLPAARDGWLVAQANLFFDQKLTDQRFPTRAELDSVSRDVAIAVRAGGHLTVLNSKALELAGIDDHYEAVSYSITGKPTVQRDATGVAIGVVTEMDKLLPLPVLSEQESREALETGITQLFTRHGVTTLGEISESTDGLRMMDAAVSAGRIGTRMHVYLWVPGTVSLDEACDHRAWSALRSQPDRFRIHGVKIFADGGYSAANAALTRPYASHGHGCGDMAVTGAEVTAAVRRVWAAGLQLAVHANGDRAQLEVCAAIAAAGPRPDGALPPRVEHAGNFVPDYSELTDAWRRAGIVPVPQPVFIQNFAEFLPAYVGEYARDRQFPFRRLLDDGWPISGSSDVWVGSEQQQTRPFFSVACCVTRRSFHGHPIAATEKIDILDALRMHTLGGATALGEQASRGSLETGKLADLIIVDRDPLTVADDEIANIHVDQVFVAGQSMHIRAPHLGSSRVKHL
ncbi:amidohydrolase [Pseudonocardia acidicola]|uniref:Amidohydrolase family protein n=1 Tax=Pseudonocardia acidicola TaxID=2724939 RepID=A0ABX1S4P7_9PSEU|nr:amidohydrolase family protein [Pseudonocardia acidicola]NMH96515.1 amidohydrolase family protein [Pseudonocardia acidicola]